MIEIYPNGVVRCTVEFYLAGTARRTADEIMEFVEGAVDALADYTSDDPKDTGLVVEAAAVTYRGGERRPATDDEIFEAAWGNIATDDPSFTREEARRLWDAARARVEKSARYDVRHDGGIDTSWGSKGAAFDRARALLEGGTEWAVWVEEIGSNAALTRWTFDAALNAVEEDV